MQLPESIDNHTVFHELGRGSMKTVVMAQHSELFDEVAIAILESTPDRDWTLRFQRELEAFRKLSHPNIVEFFGGGLGWAVYEQGPPQQRLYYAMELASETLGQRLCLQAMPSDEAVAMLLPICNAVDYAHNKNVLHRDIKPDNILIIGEDTSKLADFGFVKDLTDDEHCTGTLGGLGTLGYVAPEQYQGTISLITRAADVYSLGATLLEMLVGRVTFQSALRVSSIGAALGISAATKRLVEETAQLPENSCDEKKRSLLDLCQQCLEPDLDRRLPDVQQIIKRLERIRA